jgi:hypothetical protein
LDPEQLAELKATLVTELSEEDYYLILASKSVRMQNRVGPILKAVKFLAEPSAKDLHRAMEHFRLKDGAIDKTDGRVSGREVQRLTVQGAAILAGAERHQIRHFEPRTFLQIPSPRCVPD